MKPRFAASYSQRTREATAHLGHAPYWTLISQEDRDKAAASGAAMPDGSYPITTCSGDNSVDTAVNAVGRGTGSHNAIRKHIMKRAESLGCPADMIPDNWNADGSLKDDTSSSSTTATPFAHARSRTELIATWPFAVPPPAADDNTPPPPADKTPPAAPDAPPSEADADTAVTSDIAAIRTALEKAIADQSKDPGADATDKAVSADLAAMMTTLKTLEADQAADSAKNPAPAAPPAKPAAPADDSTPPAKPATPPAATSHLAATPPATVPATPGLPPSAPEDEPADTPVTNPVDDDGNVADDVQCTNPDCGHLASAHVDMPDGDNTGACSMQNCTCDQMAVETGIATPPAASDAGDTNGGPADPANQIDDQTAHAGTVALAGAPVGAVPPTTPPPPQSDGTPSEAAPAELNPPPPMPGGTMMGPAFTIPVAVIEGQPTGDGREIAPMALDWRIPPVPLMGLSTGAHDPAGMDMNDPAVICGRIDSFERAAGASGTQIISAKGFYLGNDDGLYFADLNESMGRLGISADIAVDVSEVQGELDEDGWPIESSMTDVLVKGTIMGLTVCPFPAFEGAYIVLGDGTAPAAAIPQAAEPAEPALTASIHWMTYEECEPCQTGIDVLVASQGPVSPPAAWFENPHFTADDGRLLEILEKRGTRALGGKFACPITITADGRVYGHAAPWGVCHTGINGSCIIAPHSKLGYAPFRRGSVVTAEGETIRTGTLTVGTGHASTAHGISASTAMAHYDNTGTAVADVEIGEDEYGIWVAGAIRPGATEAQIEALRRSTISPDWRNMGGNLEMVAGLAVNQPGFPLAVVASGHIESLVAAGAGVMYSLSHPAAPVVDEGDVTLRKALAPMLGRAKDMAKERIAALR